MIFRDRVDAGERLAAALTRYRDAPDTVVLGIPRGGVVVARAMAVALHLPLGICPVRKLGAPGNPELAIGAVDDQGIVVLDRKLSRHMGLSDDDLRSVFAYLRTIPAVKNDVPDTTVSLEVQTAIARANERIVSGK